MGIIDFISRSGHATVTGSDSARQLSWQSLESDLWEDAEERWTGARRPAWLTITDWPASDGDGDFADSYRSYREFGIWDQTARELSNDTGKARSAHRVEGAFPFHTHGLHERSCGDLCAYENPCAQRFPRDEGVCAPWGNIAHLFSSRFPPAWGYAL